MACEARQIKSLRCGGVGGSVGVCRSKQGRRRRARCRNEHARNLASGENSAPVGASRTRSRREPRLRRHFGAGGRISYGIPSGTFLPAPFSRRRARLRNRGVQDLASGENSTPEGASRTEFRREPSFRRRFLAGGRVIAAAAYKNLLPASQPRRRARPCGNVQRSEPPASPGNKALGTATSSASQTSRCLPQGPTALHRARCPGATPSPWAKGSRKGSPPP